MSQFDGYKWIKVKQFKFDPSKSWEENYKLLEQHHIEETTFLIETIRHVEKQNRNGKVVAVNESGKTIALQG